MLHSQGSTLLNKLSQKTSFIDANDESSPLIAPLAIVVGDGEASEIQDVNAGEVEHIISLYKNELYPYESSVSDSLLAPETSAFLNEVTELFTPSSESAAIGKYTEEKYTYFTEYGTQILGLFTPSGGCVYLSRNFECLTNQSSDAQLGDAFFSILHPDFRERLRDILCPISACTVMDVKAQIVRLKMQHADGKYYWYQFTVHQKPQQYICLIENIHENVQAQNILQKARLEAELALRARSEFLANMSHELRTPLNAVIGFSQIMEKGIFGKIDNPQYTDYIRYIRESGHVLLAKIEDLLEIANIDAGRVSLECEEIYVDDLIKHVMQIQYHHAQAAKVSLHYSPKGNALLFVDRLKIQHILGHLLTNAIKFSRIDGKVIIEVCRNEKNGIRISVHDNGVGMNELKCHDIRESLQQDNCWMAKNGHHIGIGLALTKEFVALHGGTIEIISSAGVGTTVAIDLPRKCIRLTPARKIEYVKQSELENG